MANNVWSSAGSTDGNVAGNWSLGWVPKAGDTMYFDATSVVNCTLSGNISCDAIEFDATNKYTGTFDANTSDVTLSGGITGNRAGVGTTIRFGSGAWSVGGHLLLRDLKFYGDGANVTMTGVAANLQQSNYEQDNGFKLIVPAGASITVTFAGGTRGFAGLDITGSLNLAEFLVYSYENVDLQAGGTITGTTGVLCFKNSSTLTTFGAGATISPGGLAWNRLTVEYTYVIPQGLYDCDLTFISQVAGTGMIVQFAAGTTTINGDLTLSEYYGSSVLILDNATNNPDLVLEGDVVFVLNTHAWTKGTGTIDIAGTGDQSIDFDGESVEDITVSNTGGAVTFESDFTCDSLTMDADTDVDCANPGDVTITMAGALDINGTSGHECAWTNIDVDCGSGDADYCTVTDSDASAGAEIDATNNCTSAGTNVNWDFGAAAGNRLRRLLICGAAA